ncbi:MAG: peptidoglycan-binding protein [Bacteroidales bacterium]|nr:peptidoglycan-binding protein [Bacteroidales bacterium]
MKANCIDISHYQGKVDFKKVAAEGIEYLILKCSENTGKDSTFERNYTDSKGFFKGVGCYIFNRATTVAAAEKEAQFAVKCLKDKQLPLGVWLDVEATSLKSLGKAMLNKIIDTEAAILQKEGFKVGVYTGYAWYKSVIDVPYLIAKYPIWVARYASDGYYHESLSTKNLDGVMIWQYSGHGKVDGIKGNVDMDVTYCEPEMWWNSLLLMDNYKLSDFVLGLQRVFNLPLTGKADTALLEATVTVSSTTNNRSAAVKHLQRYLNSLGHDCGVADGVAGKSFHKAVCEYQTKQGLTADGIISAKGKTWESLLGLKQDDNGQQPKENDAKLRCLGDIQQALGIKGNVVDVQKILAKTITVSKTKNNRSAVVKPLQELLNLLGYDCGKADGVAGNAFDKAVRKYQKDNGLVCDGEITAKGNTWRKLLGISK